MLNGGMTMPTHNPQRGEIWHVGLDPTVGAEMKKTRRCVVVSSNSVGKLPLRVVVPITKWSPKYEGCVWMVKLIPDRHNKLEVVSAADAFQVRSLSIDRFRKREGWVSAEELADIVAAIGIVVEIDLS